MQLSKTEEISCAEPGRFTAPFGGDRIRTDDLLRARQLLSQLSYAPGQALDTDILVGLERFELSTSRLSGVRSNRLSYSPTRTSFVNFKEHAL